MHIAAVYPIGMPNSVYRVIQPMLELAKRGHAVEIWEMSNVRDARIVLDCDVLYGWRLCGAQFQRLARKAADVGAAVVWDNDDDLRSIDAPSREQQLAYGGFNGNRVFRSMVAVMRMCALVTTPSGILAERYAAASGADVLVVENHVESIVEPSKAPWWSKKSDRVVVGWVANREHRSDVEHLRLSIPLQRLLDENPTVEVVSVGCDLRLDGDRYRHIPGVGFDKLREHIAGFDIGIAPIADTAFNQARSNIKIKEYAALGIPWLASPIGPYADLGKRQGGLLVPDDGWFDALNELVRNMRRRRSLARAAIAWAKTETIEANVHVWEAALEQAVARAGLRTSAPT